MSIGDSKITNPKSDNKTCYNLTIPSQFLKHKLNAVKIGHTLPELIDKKHDTFSTV